MMKSCQKFNLQEPQRNRNATENYVNLIRTSTVFIAEITGVDKKCSLKMFISD